MLWKYPQYSGVGLGITSLIREQWQHWHISWQHWPQTAGLTKWQTFEMMFLNVCPNWLQKGPMFLVWFIFLFFPVHLLSVWRWFLPLALLRSSQLAWPCVETACICAMSCTGKYGKNGPERATNANVHTRARDQNNLLNNPENPG